MRALSKSFVWPAVIGSLSGARTLCAPVLVSHRMRVGSTDGGGMLARMLSSAGAHRTLLVGAAVELVVDKLPFAGDRTAPFGVVARVLAGALAGAAVASAAKKTGPGGAAVGAAVGAAGAFVATFATYRLRRALHVQMGLPNPIAGLVEDAAVYGLGSMLVARALAA